MDSKIDAYGELFQRVSRLLFEWDPLNLSAGHNTHEYEPEAGAILPRLGGCGLPPSQKGRQNSQE